VADQQVGGAVEAHRRHGFEVSAQQFPQCAALAQPARGGQFGAGGGHATDQQAGDGVTLHAVEAEAGKHRLDPQPADVGEASGFDPGGAGRVSCSEVTSTSA
jgi:hypothetical protein